MEVPMLISTRVHALAALALMTVLSCRGVKAEDRDHDHDNDDRQIKHVFVIALENHNWTQPGTVTGGIQQIFQNPNAPFINSLVNGTAWAFIDGQLVNISTQVSYATAYHNVLATASGSNPHVHPSEPNYLWAEAGTNFGILDDDDPFADNPPNSQSTTQHLSGLLQKAGRTWKSYQEDTDLTSSGGKLIDLPLP